ncbi:biotin/lipoyl-containing protein [Microbacterium gorillae]|uniref:biotin/lipoyl-containing protein n=1 Tax=Microbacterium gorillae TaxID=1231063 RepID=UPI00058FC678|nr:biotin/lipoyl-containing protein [Microbacterium gorillae]
MTDVVFPEMSGDADQKGVIVTWFVDNGETVVEGDMIAEIAMDKVDMEVHAATAGTITTLVPEETEVAQGDVIARIE